MRKWEKRILKWGVGVQKKIRNWEGEKMGKEIPLYY